jgi:glucosamine--fructose-6-phosphate aminotransferase (isomerizing)
MFDKFIIRMEKKMPPQTHATLKEIMTQTAAWEDAIRVVDEKAEVIQKIDLARYEQVLTIGCGSTYYLSLSAAKIIQSQTGVKTTALPASELLLFPETYYGNGKNLLIAISRSGSTTETLTVVRDFKKSNRGDVILITNYPDSPLVPESDVAISISAGQEISVAQTKSFASMLVAVNAIAYLLKGEKSFSKFKDILVDSGNNLLKKYETVARDYGNAQELHQVFFLGSGPHYGLASEVSLKLKEMSQTVCEPFHFMEFRHGPISMVDKNTLVIGLISEKAFGYEMAVLDDVRKYGGRVLTIGEKNTDIEFNSGLPEDAQNVLFLPLLQLLAYFRSVVSGKNPDIPRNLSAVVNLDIE